MEWKTIIEFCVLAFLLTANTIRDIREKQICLYLTLVLGLMAFLIEYAVLQSDVLELLEGAIPGLFLLGIAGITNGKVGLGDGVVIGTAGILLGFQQTLPALLLGLLFVIIAAGAAKILKQEIREWPFIPFFSGGVLLILILTSAGIS